jgi:uncharacterized iron-regulated membrane protein
MTLRNATETALGLAGLWLIVSRVPDLLVSLVFAQDQLFLVLADFGLMVACGSGLLVYRRRLAQWLAPADEPDRPDSAAALQTAAIWVIGVLLALSGLSAILSQLVVSVADWRWPLGIYSRSLIRLAIGLALFFGARRLVTFWQRVA